MRLHARRPAAPPDRRLETCGDEEVDEIDGRLRQDSHGMAFQGNRKAVIRSPVRTGAGTIEDMAGH
jgi:hypothetical protein